MNHEINMGAPPGYMLETRSVLRLRQEDVAVLLLEGNSICRFCRCPFQVDDIVFGSPTAHAKCDGDWQFSLDRNRPNAI